MTGLAYTGPLPTSTESSARVRLASVDALRGLTVAAMLLVNDAGDWGHVYAPLEHAAWDGCTPTDLIFPFFLFVVGVSIALALVPRMDSGAARSDMRNAVLVRALRIIALGIVLHAVAHWAMDTRVLRPLGVLQRIGLCYAAAGLLAIYVDAGKQWAILIAILLGYWALLASTGPIAKGLNL